jgi:hypothetical protein
LYTAREETRAAKLEAEEARLAAVKVVVGADVHWKGGELARVSRR